MNSEEPSRIGKRWTTEEDNQLCQEIALNHRRTLCGVKSRVITNIMYPKYKNENISFDDLSSLYNIEIDLVEKYIKKMQPSLINNKNKEIENMIEYRLMMIEQRLDYIFNILNRIHQE
jgi:hypothetical protein